MRGWVTCECVTWSDGWWFVIQGRVSTSEGPRCDISIQRRDTNRIPAGARGVGGRGTGGGSHKYFVIPFRWLQLSYTLISLKYLKQRTVKTAESRKTFPTVVCWCECPPPWVSRWSLSSWLVTMESPSPPVNTILTVLIPSLALTGTNCHNCSLNDPLFVPITPVGSRP